MPDNFSVPGKGLSSVTTNPRLVAAAILQKKDYWISRFDASDLAPRALQKSLCNLVISEGAATLTRLWNHSEQVNGWISAQVDPVDVRCADRMTARGLELHELAGNVMVKVPGSPEGLAAVQNLVACGCSINITFCFTVSQFQAGISAIERGRAMALENGIETSHCKYVITFMIGRFSCQPELSLQASERNIDLSDEDKRWAELMIYQEIQTLVRASSARIKTLLSSIKIDVDEYGRKHSWHLEKTGQYQTCYTLTPDVVEFLIERESHGHPVSPGAEVIQPPPSTVSKLMQIPYFTDAFRVGGIEPYDFCNHEAFINTCNEASMAYRRLVDYCTRLSPIQNSFEPTLNSVMAAEYGVAL
ncbi:transaldolase family protein [Pseudomonas sp. NPDC089734]|uniref:transaldolase family protein n=1 Tax=Pseudomonas sp. NPDC089734 TaxID=3364469 RepID=UPI00382F1BDD